MTTLNEGAFAKLNLTLDVLGKREDGYHDIKSVMQAISLRDDIEIDVDTGRPWCILCDKDNIPCDETNLAWKAARLFFDTIGKEPDGIEIRITKRIPVEAGLGGGSADAAAVLRALNRHYDMPFSLPALAELGGKIGSDIPFCVLCGTAMAEGRGEKLRPLPGMPDCTTRLSVLVVRSQSTSLITATHVLPSRTPRSTEVTVAPPSFNATACCQPSFVFCANIKLFSAF